MELRFRIIVSLFLFSLLYPFVSSAQEADLKRIRVVKGGELKDMDRAQDMERFVEINGTNGGKVPEDKKISPGNTIFVKPGANLLIEYKKQKKKQKAWLDYDTRVTIYPDGVSLKEGEWYVIDKGGFFNGGKLGIQGLSEYYMKVEANGKTTLYVVKGKVIATDETGNKKTVSQAMAIDESLSERRLPEEEIRGILMWPRGASQGSMLAMKENGRTLTPIPTPTGISHWLSLPVASSPCPKNPTPIWTSATMTFRVLRML